MEYLQSILNSIGLLKIKEYLNLVNQMHIKISILVKWVNSQIGK